MPSANHTCTRSCPSSTPNPTTITKITIRNRHLWGSFAMAEPSMRTNSNVQLLQEHEALSQSHDQPQKTRRAASLVLSPLPNPNSQPQTATATTAWKAPAIEETKGIWSWKPMRALSHIGKQRFGCLFSVEVIAIRGLPAAMNGLRFSVSIRKKETKDGTVKTMPSRMLQGSADFEETLFIQCHVYCSGGAGTGKPLKFEPRLFSVSTFAVDVPELELGKSFVDLSQLVRESVEKSLEGARIRQWDAAFELSSMAKGGVLVVKLGFQIMEDIGVGIYSQVERLRLNEGRDATSIARKQSKSSFSVRSLTKRMEPSKIPSEESAGGIKVEEPGPPPLSTTSIQKSELKLKADELNLPEFEAVNKGVEIQGSKADELNLPEFEAVNKGVEIQGSGEGEDGNEVQSEKVADESSSSSEIVKEVVHNCDSLMELDSIAKQIKALKLLITSDGTECMKTTKESETLELVDDEEMVTREFLQMLELKASKQRKNELDLNSPMKTGPEEGLDGEERVFVPDLAKGLGCVVQTRDGGHLACMNPLNLVVQRQETPKLTMQISRSFLLQDHKMATGFEVFQRLATVGLEELGSKLLSLAAMDDLTGKTAGQIAFEGIASAIVNGRSKEGASSRAARSIAIVKTMASSLHEGRGERISTGIWTAKEDPVAMEEILAFSLQKIEAMALEALKIQAGVAEEEAPFYASPLIGKEDSNNNSELAILTEDWVKACGSDNNVTLLAVIQLRDPLRRYEAVGAPSIVVVEARKVENCEADGARFKVTSLHLGGMKLSSGAAKSSWDGEKQRLTAMHWLVAHGLGKAGRKIKPGLMKEGRNLVWSLSSQVMADMWLNPRRNPDVNISNQ